MRHTRLADLAASFPALLFALAVPGTGLDPARALARVIDGQSLPDAAAAARIPLWLRRLPPEALTRPITALPDGELFPSWLPYGRKYSEQRHSPLRQINDSTGSALGLAWSVDMQTLHGLEATPLVKDGVMYVSSAWSVVHAFDARTGSELWRHDPAVPKGRAKYVCCGVVNRGVALYQGKVFVGAYDGRLIALDAATGAKVWEVDTLIDRSRPYTITGAPRVFKGKVIIGNGGAEFGVRGYITAYHAQSGEQKWRWFTVPGDPAKPFEDESMSHPVIQSSLMVRLVHGIGRVRQDWRDGFATGF